MSEVQFNYQLANTAGYSFNIVKMGYDVYDELAYFKKTNFPDIEITRPGITSDLNLLHTKCLMTINGYAYPTVYQGGRLYIPNATKSMLKARNNSVGILSFNKLTNGFNRYQITEDMITSEDPFTLYEKTTITFPEDIQVPILSICGYLIFENPEYFYRVSNRSFILRLDRLYYIEKLYELNRYRDIFKEMDVPTSVNNESMIDATLVKSDEKIKKFLTLFNSFFISLPVDNMSIKQVYLENSHVPGNFRTEIEPNMPIMIGYGKLAEYFKKKTNDNKFSVYMSDGYYNRHLISNMSFSEIEVYNDHRIPGRTYRLTQAFFLDLRSTI